MPAQHELHETFDAILVLGCGSQYFCLITDESESLMSTVKCCLAVRGSMCFCARLVWLSMAAGGDNKQLAVMWRYRQAERAGNALCAFSTVGPFMTAHGLRGPGR